MSCIHNVWNCYCKHDEKVLEKPCSPLCKNYCTEETSMKKILNKGPATDTNCSCNKSTADNDYVSMLEMFINKLYTDHNWGFFGLTSFQAEQHVKQDMRCLGYNTEMVNKACVDTMNSFKSKNNAPLYRLKRFVNDMLSMPHKDYENYCSTNFRFVLTLILGYLHKLNTVDIILCHDPEVYFKKHIDLVPVHELRHAVDKTRTYVEESKDNWLADGMRMVDQWFEKLAKENIPAKELTIADIEKQLGYKIKIVGEEK